MREAGREIRERSQPQRWVRQRAGGGTRGGIRG